MRMTVAMVVLAALALVGCSSCGGSASSRDPCRAGAVFVVTGPGGMVGHAVAISPTEALTASHVGSENGAVLSVCDGGGALVLSSDPADFRPALLSGTFAEYLETGPLSLGLAEVRTTRALYPVEVIDAGSPYSLLTATFTGYSPAPGDSGAPVVQGGRVVGVVQGTLSAPNMGAFSPVE